MKFRECRYLVLSDLYRITGNARLTTLLKYLLIGGSFKYTFWMRVSRYAQSSPLLRFTLYPLSRLILIRLMYRFGISVPHCTRIGSGFYIGHFGGIFVSPHCVIGKNCNISHDVTVGKGNRGKYAGNGAIIGDNVYIAPGAKVIGSVRIGNNVAIGANCVVTKDVPDNSVIVGVPGKVISQAGTEGYVTNTDYDGKI